MITFVFSILTIIAVAVMVTYSNPANSTQVLLTLGIIIFIDIYTYLFIRSYLIIGEEQKVSPLYCAGKAMLLIIVTVGMVVIPIGVLSLFAGTMEGIFWTLMIGSVLILPVGAAAFITGLIFGTIHRGSPRSPLIP